MNNLKSFIYLSTAFSFIIPSFAFAEDIKDKDVIIVTGNRTKEKIEDVGLSVSIISTEEIKASQQTSIPDLLRQLPGVSMVRNGGYGTTTALRIRGTEAHHIVTLIDGVKLSDPSSPQGNLDMGALLIGNIERVELLRGAQSVVWGSQAIGGVVQLFTKTPETNAKTNIKAEIGSMTTQNYAANSAKRFGNLGASIGVSYFDTNGYSAFSELRGGKEDDGYRNFSTNAKLNYDFTDNISASLFGYYQDSSLRYDNTNADANNRQDGNLYIGNIGFKFKNFDGKLTNNLNYSKTESKRKYPYGNYDGKADRFSYVADIKPRDDFGLIIGYENEKSEYDISGVVKNNSINSIFIQANAKPIKSFSISAGIRSDNHEEYGNKDIFDINASYKLFDDKTIIRASYGEGFRAPSLYELYSPYGNLNLKPESAQSWDLGISQKLGDKILLGINGFKIESEDLIAYSSGKYVNVSLASSKGYEFILDYSPIENLSIGANYTYDEAINSISKKNLPRRPKDSFNFNAKYQWFNGLNTGIRVTYVGDTYDDAANKTMVKEYTIADILLSYKINPSLEIYGRVENAADKKYESIYRYGTQRRAYFTGIRYSF